MKVCLYCFLIYLFKKKTYNGCIKKINVKIDKRSNKKYQKKLKIWKFHKYVIKITINSRKKKLEKATKKNNKTNSEKFKEYRKDIKSRRKKLYKTKLYKSEKIL